MGQCESFGAVLDMCSYSGDEEDKFIFAGINSKLVCFNSEMARVSEIESQIMVYKVKVVNSTIELLVCDIMKSLTVYTYAQQKFTVKARYPNGQWCFEALSVNPDATNVLEMSGYLSCDFNKNLAYLTEPSDDGANLLSLSAQHSLKEQVNSSLLHNPKATNL